MPSDDENNAAAPKDEGAEQAPKAETITIRVKDQSGDETMFKVKKSTNMSKIFEAYAGRKSIPANALRFMLDGERIQAGDTPESLDLEDRDQIDVYLEQTGGC